MCMCVLCLSLDVGCVYLSFSPPPLPPDNAPHNNLQQIADLEARWAQQQEEIETLRAEAASLREARRMEVRACGCIMLRLLVGGCLDIDSSRVARGVELCCCLRYY